MIQRFVHPQIEQTFGQPVILQWHPKWLYESNSANHHTLYTVPLPALKEALTEISPPHSDYMPDVGVTQGPSAQHPRKRFPLFDHCEFKR